ncbi:phorbol-12-myristate-13-acetate-induced protein 1 [Sebastes umbrosus]|nr:phorbol-12-myristate-13-acetate-induced protein 1 [Sebastes umbrosus]
MARHDLSATIDHCAHELRRVGDELNWRYKLLEILIKNYKTVTKIK